LSNFALALKKDLPWNFSLYWICFLHSDFFSNLRLPWKAELPWIFHCLAFFFSFRSFKQLALALKNRVALDFFTVLKYFLSFRIFEQLALALKNRVALDFLLYWNIFHHSGFLSNLRLPWKTELPWIFLLYWNIFYHSGFWATSACPENRVCPEIFQARGEAAPRPPPRTPMVKSISYTKRYRSPLWSPLTWMHTCASLKHREVMKAEPSLLNPRKLKVNLEILIVNLISLA